MMALLAIEDPLALDDSIDKDDWRELSRPWWPDGWTDADFDRAWAMCPTVRGLRTIN